MAGSAHESTRLRIGQIPAPFAAQTISRWGDTFNQVALVVLVFRLLSRGFLRVLQPCFVRAAPDTCERGSTRLGKLGPVVGGSYVADRPRPGRRRPRRCLGTTKRICRQRCELHCIRDSSRRPAGRSSRRCAYRFDAISDRGARRPSCSPPGARCWQLSKGFAAISAGAASALLVVLAERQLNVGPSGFGLLLSAIGIGAATGPLLLRLRREDEPSARWLFEPYLLRGGVDLGLAFTHHPLVAAVALGLYGVGTSTGMLTYQSVLQIRVAEGIRGRAFAILDVVWQTGRLDSRGWRRPRRRPRYPSRLPSRRRPAALRRRSWFCTPPHGDRSRGRGRGGRRSGGDGLIASRRVKRGGSLGMLTTVVELAVCLDRRSIVVTFVLVALLACAIFMPAMTVTALVGCGVAIVAIRARRRPLEPVVNRRVSTPAAPPIRTPSDLNTGPPPLVPLRT